jgi:RNA polymerase sigma-70 factor, ECF subfamily
VSDSTASLFARAAKAWPAVKLSPEAFATAWESRGLLDPVRAEDVFLAVSIELRDPAALQWLQAQVQRGAKALEGRVQRGVLDDVESAVVELVAVGSATRPPRIQAYAGRGPLAGWLQVILTRAAWERASSVPATLRETDVEEAVLRDLAQASQAPELQALKQRFEGVLGPALRAAGLRLTPRDRTLISLHYADAASLDELARAYQVHRTTVARWLAQARSAFLEATRDELSTRTHVARHEVDSLVRALQSSADVSLRRMLGPTHS